MRFSKRPAPISIVWKRAAAGMRARPSNGASHDRPSQRHLQPPDPRDAASHRQCGCGDDVYGDDPTVKALERTVADLLGKEDAVYMPTGTMTNQVAIRAHTEHGDAVLFDQNAHVYILEGGAPAAFSGVLPRLLPGVRGIFRAADVDAAMGTSHPFFPATVAAPVPCYVWRTPTTSA